MPRAALSLVVPLYREAGGVAALATRLRTFVRDDCRDREVELVLVDDGSDDATLDELRRHFADLNPTLLRHDTNRGLTAALATGSRAARGELIAHLDADLTYDPSIVAELARDIDAGADVALASCYHPDGVVEGVRGWRLWLSRSASRVYRRLAQRRDVYTFTCMVRVYRAPVWAACTPRRQGFVGVTETLLRALAGGHRIVERPATLRSRTVGESKMRVLRVARGHLGLCWSLWRGRL